MSVFDTISPLDYRYYGTNPALIKELKPYLSEEALIQYLCKVEVALVETLAEEGICTQKNVDEIKSALQFINAEDVYREEQRIHHLMRAVVNCFGRHVSSETTQFIHLTATSNDIICTAEAMRYQEFTQKILLPKLLQLEQTLIFLAEKEKATVQIGRTHGQHAVPITFGFAMSEYVARLGERIHEITKKAVFLRGQLSGAVGAYNAQSLIIKDPFDFEKKVLQRLDLKPATYSTQIVVPECMADYVHSIISTLGVCANLADDMRHLQRTEIGEVGESFDAVQVGSSTMPQKKNPINFENVKSLYKTMMPRMITLYLDQISEHQRDLTNSASSRFTIEIIAGFYIAVDRMTTTMQKLAVDKEMMQKNFNMSRDFIIAEQLYVLLAVHGIPNAHETVRQLTMKAHAEGKSLLDTAKADAIVSQAILAFTEQQKNILGHPETYIGKSVEKTEHVCAYWRKELGLR